MKSMYRVFWALLAFACFSSSSSANFNGRKILDYPEITCLSSSSARFHGRKILDDPEITCFPSSSSARFHGRKILDYPEITCFSSSSSARFHGRKILDYPEITCFSSSSARFHGRKILYYPEITCFSSSSSSAGFHGRKILDYPESVQPSLAPNRPSIDPNLVLILAALLCALFFGLGLNLMIRCALCLTSVLRVPAMAGRGHMTRADHVTSAVGTGRANTGLKKAVIDALPLVAYGGAAKNGCADNGGGADIECVICLKEFVDGERVRVLPKCAHCFHVECIDRWFVSHSLCPICRTRMPESLEKKTAAANVPCSNCGRTNGDESTAPDGSQNVGTQSVPLDLASCSGTGSNVVVEGAVS